MNPPDYGGICADQSYKEEAKVICRQLGYDYVDFTYINESTEIYTNTNHLVWLKDVFCKQSDLHILRCQYKVIYGSDSTNPQICGTSNPNKLLIKCSKINCNICVEIN